MTGRLITSLAFMAILLRLEFVGGAQSSLSTPGCANSGFCLTQFRPVQFRPVTERLRCKGPSRKPQGSKAPEPLKPRAFKTPSFSTLIWLSKATRHQLGAFVHALRAEPSR